MREGALCRCGHPSAAAVRDTLTAEVWEEKGNDVFLPHLAKPWAVCCLCLPQPPGVCVTQSSSPWTPAALGSVPQQSDNAPLSFLS